MILVQKQKMHVINPQSCFFFYALPKMANYRSNQSNLSDMQFVPIWKQKAPVKVFKQHNKCNKSPLTLHIKCYFRVKKKWFTYCFFEPLHACFTAIGSWLLPAGKRRFCHLNSSADCSLYIFVRRVWIYTFLDSVRRSNQHTGITCRK